MQNPTKTNKIQPQFHSHHQSQPQGSNNFLRIQSSLTWQHTWCTRHVLSFNMISVKHGELVLVVPHDSESYKYFFLKLDWISNSFTRAKNIVKALKFIYLFNFFSEKKGYILTVSKTIKFPSNLVFVDCKQIYTNTKDTLSDSFVNINGCNAE